MKTPKLKKYRIDYTAEIKGFKIIEAFDEMDAEEQAEQFEYGLSPEDFDEEPIRAEIQWITEEKPKRKKGKRGQSSPRASSEESK